MGRIFRINWENTVKIVAKILFASKCSNTVT